MAMAMSSSSSSSFVNIPTAARQRTNAAYGAVLHGFSMPRTSLKNAGTAAAAGSRLLPVSTLLGTRLRSAEEGCLFDEQRRAAGAAVVRAASIGVVKKVEQASKSQEGVYFNVAFEVLPGSEVVKWYKTPGQYVNILPVKSQYDSPSAFFMASPPLNGTDLEFLIEDVPNTVANEIINSKPGDSVVITTSTYSQGFDLSDIEAAESVLMFASGYGLGPFRALIEKGFQANKKKNAILYTLYPKPELEPYMDRHAGWEATGVRVQRGLTKIQETVPSQTVVLMIASTVQQQKLAKYFEEKGVPAENIQTLFDGIPVSDNAYYNKVTHKLNNYPKFLHSGPKNVPVELKI